MLIASESKPLSAITLSEVFATSDVPKGVINVLTGRRAELAPWLASHMEVDAIDLAGLGDTPAARRMKNELQLQSVENLKRVVDYKESTSLQRIIAFMEAKTVWHPIGI